MEEERKPRNIFEEASRSRVPRRIERKPEVEEEVKQSQIVDNVNVESSSSAALSNEDADVMLSKMHTMRRELEEKMDDVISLAGVSKEEVTTFLDNPDNFSPTEWEKVKEKKEELAKMAMQITGQKDNKRKVARKEEADTKKLRQKSLGGRKRWIPMR